MANFQLSPVTSCFLITPICFQCCVIRSLWFLWKKLIALFNLCPLSVSIFELNFEYSKLLQQFLLIFRFWEVFIIFYLRHSSKTPFPFVLWTVLACSPRPAQHGSGCAALLLPGCAQSNAGDIPTAARAFSALVLLCRAASVPGAWIHPQHCTALGAKGKFCWILTTLKYFLATFPPWCGTLLQLSCWVSEYKFAKGEINLFNSRYYYSSQCECLQKPGGKI